MVHTCFCDAAGLLLLLQQQLLPLLRDCPGAIILPYTFPHVSPNLPACRDPAKWLHHSLKTVHKVCDCSCHSNLPAGGACTAA